MTRARRTLVPRWVIAAVAVALLTVIVIAGLRGVRVGTEAESGSDPMSTPTAVPTSDSAPTQVFGGDCDAMLPESSLEQLHSGPVVFGSGDVASEVVDRNDFVVRATGGVTCHWSLENGGGGGLIVAFPDAAAPLAREAECATGFGEGVTCGLEIVQNGIRFSGGVIGQPGDDADDVRQLAGTIVDILRGSANGVPQPIMPVLPAGAWPVPIDCAAVDRVARDRGTLGAEVGLSALAGTDAPPAKGVSALLDGQPAATCSWTGVTSVVDVSLRGGGAWAEPMVAAAERSRPVDVGGFDRAYSVGGPDGATSVHLFRGHNWMVAGVTDTGTGAHSVLAGIADAADAVAAGAAPSATNPATPSELAESTITTAGYGAVKMGQPVPSGSPLVRFSPFAADECPGDGIWSSNDTRAVFVETDGAMRNGRVTHITVLGESVETRSGATVGMTLADLGAMFPSAEVRGDFVIVADALGQVVFETDGEVVTSIQVIGVGATPMPVAGEIGCL